MADASGGGIRVVSPTRGYAAFARSSTMRIVALMFALQLVVSGAVLLTVRHLTRGDLRRDEQALTFELRDDLLAGFEQGGPAALRGMIAARLRRSGGGTRVMLLALPDGRALAGNLPHWPNDIPTALAWRVIGSMRVGGAAPERMGVTTLPLPGGLRLLAGHVVDADMSYRRALEEAMLTGLLLALPLALLSALFAARLIASRVRRIASTAQAVGGGDLSRRVPLTGSGDAFETLGRSVNAMLDRTEDLVSELRIVTDGLAHDLRSPLTRLKARIDGAIGTTATDPGTQSALAAALAEADILLAMLDTALQISRAEAGIGRDRFAATDLGRMIADMAEMYGPIAEDRGLAIDVVAGGDLTLAVHRELLGQALANLVDNALKYGAGRIRLSALETQDAVVLTVADDGPGIPPARHDEALRRFGRLDAARHVGGAGLGLALAAAVARLHRGRLALEDNRPGLRVRLELPR